MGVTVGSGETRANDRVALAIAGGGSGKASEKTADGHSPG